MKAWIAGAAAGLMLGATPAAALTLEQFFALPNVFVGDTAGDVIYTSDFDELDAIDDGSNLDLGIFANVGGVLAGPPFGSGFGASALTAVVGGSFVSGAVEDLSIADDFIAILYQVTQDDDDRVGDWLALRLFFDTGTFTLGSFLDDFEDPRWAYFELTTNGPDTVIPLPATGLLLGFGALALAAARRRRG